MFIVSQNFMETRSSSLAQD